MAVLHIVLTILKIIGILLLILLGILLLTVLAVLFCPVRYSAQGYKDEEKYGGRAKVSWLCHLISFTVWYDSREGETGYGIRIFGIPLLKLLEALSKRKEKKRLEEVQKTEKEILQKESREISDKEEMPDEEQPEKELESERASEEKPVRQEESSGRKTEESFRQAEGKGQIFFRRIKSIFKLPGKIFGAFRKFRLTAEGICDKIRKIRNFLESERFKGGMCLIIQEGKKLLTHVKPRKIEGHIKFGTEDPCLTGEILGAAGIFYPLYGENFSIEPCFEQRVLEGTISLRGRIYGIVLLTMAVKIFRSRDIRYIIRHFRQ